MLDELTNLEQIINSTQSEGSETPATDAVETAPNADTEISTWKWAPEVDGYGEAPDWFEGAKYKTVEDQAKAYPALAKKMGAFIGAPKDGYDDGKFTESLDMSNPFLQKFNEVATEMNMSQGGYEQMLDMFQEHENAVTFDANKFVESLSEDEKGTAITIANWAKNNFSTEECQIMDTFITDKSSMNVLNKLRTMSRHDAQIPNGSKDHKLVTRKDIESMIINNYDKYQNDENYRNRVENLRSKIS